MDNSSYRLVLANSTVETVEDKRC